VSLGQRGRGATGVLVRVGRLGPTARRQPSTAIPIPPVLSAAEVLKGLLGRGSPFRTRISNARAERADDSSSSTLVKSSVPN
jgi:hypothetical protein